MKYKHHYYACAIAKQGDHEPSYMGCQNSDDTIAEAKEYFEFLKSTGWDLLATWIQSYDGIHDNPKIICFNCYVNILGYINYKGKHYKDLCGGN